MFYRRQLSSTNYFLATGSTKFKSIIGLSDIKVN